MIIFYIIYIFIIYIYYVYIMYVCVCVYNVCVCILTYMNVAFLTAPEMFVCSVLLRPGEGSSEEIPVHSRWDR